MISWIVASHNPVILADNLARTLRPVLKENPGDELVVVEDAPSIAVAYNEGTRRAECEIRCYLHHDVILTGPERLRLLLIEYCIPDVGIVGVIGSRTPVVPWWSGDTCGSVVDGRAGRLYCGPGGHACAYLDGLLLATRHVVEWDETIPGWHLYDHDACRQQLKAGRQNFCLPRGAGMVHHNTAGPLRMGSVAGWDDALARFEEKWHG